MKKLHKCLKKRGYVRIPLYPVPIPEHISHHYLVKVKLNGKKGFFMIDTGASTSVLNIRLAGKYKVKPLSSQPEIMAYGASDVPLDVAFTEPVKKLRIGRWQIKKLPMILMDISHLEEHLDGFEIQGIIGSDILMLGEAILDYAHHSLYLKSKS